MLATFGGASVLKVVLESSMTQDKLLTVCWCRSDSTCQLNEDYTIPVISVSVLGPAFGLQHSCVHDTTCLMAIEDTLTVAKAPSKHALVVKADCAGQCGGTSEAVSNGRGQLS